MSSNFLGTKGHLRKERPTSSLIKPHLKNLSGSGTKLDGMIIERDVEQPNSGIYRPTGDNPKHIVVLHSAHPATLEWRFNGRQEEAFFSEGEAIINPAGLFVAPRWKAPVELLLMAINPGLVNQIARKMGSDGHVELEPRFHFRDELLEQLAKSLNAKAAYFFIQEAGKRMNDGGKIITILTSLLAAFTGLYSTYAGSKASVEHFTRAAAKEFGPRGISVANVAPGPMDTPFFYPAKSPEAVTYHKSQSMNGKLTDISDIVPIVKFLATDGWWITGQTIFANGGYTTR